MNEMDEFKVKQLFNAQFEITNHQIPNLESKYAFNIQDEVIKQKEIFLLHERLRAIEQEIYVICAPYDAEQSSQTQESADAPQAGKVEAVTDNAPSVDHDETLAALFDAVPVETLEKMFPTHTDPSRSKWKSWAEKAKANGLKDSAKVARGLFNPYKAGVWFLRQGIKGWDIARLNRTLKNNLPARSSDKAHLLDGGIG